MVGTHGSRNSNPPDPTSDSAMDCDGALSDSAGGVVVAASLRMGDCDVDGAVEKADDDEANPR